MGRTLELEHKRKITLPAVEPFNFTYTVKKPSHFYSSLEYYDDDAEVFYRALRINEKPVGIKMHAAKDGKSECGIIADVFSKHELNKEDSEELKRRIVRSYGLDEDIREFYSSVKDQKLKPVIGRMRGMRNSCIENLYEILNISVILQNTTVKRSEQMMKSLLDNFGNRVRFDGVELDVFYDPKTIAKSEEARLRELKLGYRAKFIMGLSEYFSSHPGIEANIGNMNFNDASSELQKINGIGPYSASIALFAYNRHPNFINFDVWNRKILADFIFGKEVEKEVLEAKCEKLWGRFKGYAALYVIEDYFVRHSELQRTGEESALRNEVAEHA